MNVNMSAKFDEEVHSGLVSIVFISLFPNMYTVTFTSKINRVQSLTFVTWSNDSS